MRTRVTATVAALSGALALSALAVPAAHAADGGAGDTVITKVTANGGKPIVLGTTQTKKVTVAVTATDATGIDYVKANMWHGTDMDNDIDGSVIPEGDGDCTVLEPTTSTCKVSFEIDPYFNTYKNSLAGKWNIWSLAAGTDAHYVSKDKAGSVRIIRAAKLTTNASPEPVKKGKTITVAGALTRANWETHQYAGYTKQSVKLEFKKKGAASWTTLKTVKSGSKGKLSTTVKASADGTFRYVFAGTSTTQAVTSKGDFVDVR